jgi:hypothetical protein
MTDVEIDFVVSDAAAFMICPLLLNLQLLIYTLVSYCSTEVSYCSTRDLRRPSGGAACNTNRGKTPKRAIV